jgi:hypothetical protein
MKAKNRNAARHEAAATPHTLTYGVQAVAPTVEDAVPEGHLCMAGWR